MSHQPVSRQVDLDGPVRYLDHGGPAGAPAAPALLCVHGLGGSAENWMSLAPLLTDRFRVFALDLPGFGLTPVAGRRCGIRPYRDLVQRFVTTVVGGPALLVGNSMGGLTSAMVAARYPELVSGLVLVDPALPLRLTTGADPRILGMFAATVVPGLRRLMPASVRPRTPDDVARQLLAVCYGDPRRITPEVLAAHLELARNRQDPAAPEAFVAVTRSLLATLASRRLPALLARISAPVLLLHGSKDRLVPARSARMAAAAYPAWTYREAYGVGHVPQLEVPRWTADQILGWAPAGSAEPVSLRST